MTPRNAPQGSRPQRVVISALTATLATMWLTGCSSVTEADADYAEICQDQTTRKRVDDSECDSARGGGTYRRYGWVYMPIHGDTSVPGVGSDVPASASRTRPAGTGTRISSKGGSYAKTGTSRGGFGGKSGGGS